MAFLYGAAFLLFLGETVWPAFIGQILWIALESYLCTDRSLGNIRNLAVQLLILYVLGSNMVSC